MLRHLFLASAIAATPVFSTAADKPPASLMGSLNADAQPILARIFARVQAGIADEALYAEDLAALQKIVDRYRTARKEEAGKLAVLISDIQSRVLNDDAKAKAQLERVKAEFVGTQAAAEAEGKLAVHERQARSEATRAALVGKPAPEIHFTWSSNKELQQLTSLKGKAVVVDFWATWCGPCIRSFPHLRELSEKYRNKPVVFLGVTSIQGMVSNLKGGQVNTQGNPAKELELLQEFIQQHQMTWTIALSRENVFNEDYGITGIPHVALIDRNGVVRKLSHPAQLTDADIDALIE